MANVQRIPGTDGADFVKGSRWFYAEFLAADGFRCSSENGPAKILLSEIEVTGGGPIFVTFEITAAEKIRSGRKDRLQRHFMATRGYRATKAEAVVVLLQRTKHRRETALQNLAGLDIALAVLAAWKEES